MFDTKEIIYPPRAGDFVVLEKTKSALHPEKEFEIRKYISSGNIVLMQMKPVMKVINVTKKRKESNNLNIEITIIVKRKKKLKAHLTKGKESDLL